MRTLTTTLLLLAALAPAARAEWRKMNGQRVPVLTADEWLNTGRNAPTLASLRGKVWLLEFFATW